MTIYIFTRIIITSGIIIGFYFRDLTICSHKFLKDEFDFIKNSFMQLQYRKSFIECIKMKPLKIHRCKCSPKIPTKKFSNTNLLSRHIILPNNLTPYFIEKNLK